MEGYIMFLRREPCSFLKVGVRKAPDLRQMLQTVKKPTFVLRMGSGNEAFPEWNPPCGRQSRRLANSGYAAIRQGRLCLSEEKGEFQGFLRFFRKPLE